MNIYARSILTATLAAAALFAGQTKAWAGQTKIWSESEYADFDKGILHNLSSRSDGLLTLAPVSHELFDASTAYLWSLAQDSKGNIYAGGGANAKVYRIPPDGKGKVLAELDALQVQAVAVDSHDRVYAATAPDGKVYRISPAGKPEVFYDPHAKYIWALLFDHSGDLLVATGDPGAVHRVTPDGKGKVFFPSDETHIRSMALDGQGNLIVGTDPGGLVLRVTPSGEGFVLYQMARKEVTAVAVGRDGTIYAAGVGGKGSTSGPLPSPGSPPPVVAPVIINVPGTASPTAPRSTASSPALLGPPGGVGGGSDLYRIESGGSPLKIWSNSQDVVYAIAFDTTGRVLIGTGNKGGIYRVESPSLYTALLTAPATQVTAFLTGPDGRLFAATGNVGKVYEIGPGTEKEGSIESDTFDAGIYSLWGRLSFEANMNGGHVALETRSGNLDQAGKYWSNWSPAITATEGARIVSPPSRFIQWKATLRGETAGHSPELESVDVAYLPKNLAPAVEQIEVTQDNYRFPPVTASAIATPSSLSLPPLGRTGSPPSPLFSSESGSTTISPAMQYAKGWRGARWLASDPNGDGMLYTVEIRGEKETRWKPLKDKVAEKYVSFDTTAFPDGEYRLRVTASDSPSNPPAEALSGSLASDPFTIDNTPPRITGLTASMSAGKLRVHWHAADALNNVTKAEYSLDGGDWTLAAPVSKLSDSLELDYDLTLDGSPGEHTIAVRVQDDFENQASEKAVVR